EGLDAGKRDVVGQRIEGSGVGGGRHGSTLTDARQAEERSIAPLDEPAVSAHDGDIGREE
ncbi:MAG: hypothetical protein K0S49_2794, partial [Microbacterium sp.]|nr:hypothetical protein [Microbacterium sp.]